MDLFLIIIIVVVGLIGITFLVAMYSKKSTLKAVCAADSDCSAGDICVHSRDFSKNMCVQKDKKDCVMEKCTADSDCAKCFNFPPYQCVDTSTGDYKTSDGKPFPAGKWCLPRVDSSTTCNPVTSDTVVTVADDGYKYRCSCLYNFITQASVDSDCNIPLTCDGQGELYVPSYPKKICSQDADCGDGGWCSNRQCYVNWKGNTNLNPVEGLCKCNVGYTPFNEKEGKDVYKKKCVVNSCYPGTKGEDGACVCPAGTVACPAAKNSPYCKIESICAPDPCAPGGKYENGACRCGAGYAEEKADNFVGSRCRQLCEEGNNICGDRGTCYAENGVEKCRCNSGHIPADENDTVCSDKCIQSGGYTTDDAACCSRASNRCSPLYTDRCCA